MAIRSSTFSYLAGEDRIWIVDRCFHYIGIDAYDMYCGGGVFDRMIEWIKEYLFLTMSKNNYYVRCAIPGPLTLEDKDPNIYLLRYEITINSDNCSIVEYLDNAVYRHTSRYISCRIEDLHELYKCMCDARDKYESRERRR